MSYEINNIPAQPTQIQKAQGLLNNGGGGNAGYFQGGKKKKNEPPISVFEEMTDEFISSENSDLSVSETSGDGIMFNGHPFKISDRSFVRLKQLLKRLDII